MRSALSWLCAAESRATGLGANHRTYRLYPSYPPSNLQIQQHVVASGIISRSTDFSRLHFAELSHLIRCPLNALMPGSETGSLA